MARAGAPSTSFLFSRPLTAGPEEKPTHNPSEPVALTGIAALDEETRQAGILMGIHSVGLCSSKRQLLRVGSNEQPVETSQLGH